VLRKLSIGQSIDCFAETIRISGSLFLIAFSGLALWLPAQIQ
jgi:hypothetical protein